MTHQEAFFYMLKAARTYYQYADFDAPEPNAEEERLINIYQKYLEELFPFDPSGGQDAPTSS